MDLGLKNLKAILAGATKGIGRATLEVLARLNDDDGLKDVPVLVITAWNETREDVLAAGADDFVTKPFDPEDLKTAVNRLVAA